MMELVSFYSDLGYKLAAEIFIPDNLKEGEKRAGVVICHGYTAIKKFIVPDIAKAFCDAGYVALIFDYRGFGESEGPRWRFIPTEQVRDIQNAMTFLQTQDSVDLERIGLVGVSYGGANAVYTAAIDFRVKCVAVNGAIGDGEKWLRSLRRQWEWEEFFREIEADRVNRVLTGKSKEVGQWDVLILPPDPSNYTQGLMDTYPDFNCTLTYEVAEAIINFKPVEVVHRISPRPVLFIHAARDPLVPTEQSEQMFARAGEPKKLVIEQVEYRSELYQKKLNVVIGNELSWFQEHLPCN
jgi:dipeptidyl aminopeptidase/acylaminoacyl peptidase